MKKTLLTLIIAAAGILASAQIRPEPKKDGGIFAGMDPATRIQLMKQFDKDGDGALTSRSAPPRAKRSKTNLPTLNSSRKTTPKT